VYEKASGLVFRQAPDEEAKAGEVDRGFGGSGQACVILAHPPVMAGPRQCAFHDPPSRQRLEASGQGDLLEGALRRDLEAAAG
jgi:hypothetical protein